MKFTVNRGYRWDSDHLVCEWVDDQQAPEVVVCLRLSDAPSCFVPIDGCVSRCTSCDEPVVYNPSGRLARVDKVCLRCMTAANQTQRMNSLTTNQR